MTHTLEQLKQATQDRNQKRQEDWRKKQFKDANRWTYTYLPKPQKEYIDNLTERQLLDLLEQEEYVLFCWAVGVIADRQLKGGYENDPQSSAYTSSRDEHLKCLKMVQKLYQIAQDR